MVHVELGMLRLAGSWETLDFGSAVQNLPQIVRLPSFPSPLGVRPESRLGSLPLARPTPGLLSWVSPPNEVLAGSTPSWHPIFRRPRLLCLKTSVNSYQLADGLGLRVRDTNARLCVWVITGHSARSQAVSPAQSMSCFSPPLPFSSRLWLCPPGAC